jgi:tetratricopeptide (TPR) repeat protein
LNYFFYFNSIIITNFEFKRGDIYAQRNETSLAIFNYSNAIKFNPTEYQAYLKRGILYEESGDILMSMDDYLTTTKINPKIHEAWFKHGMNYFRNNNWHYAIVDFNELIKHNPDNQAKARLYRGICYLNIEEYQASFDDFSIAIHLNPNDWQSFYYRACLLRKLDPEKALQDFSISLQLEMGYDNMNAYLHRALLYIDKEEYDEAIKDYESVLSLDKEFAPAYVNMGIIYMNILMNYWKAIKCFNLAIKSKPTYIRAYLCRAQAYRSIHDLHRAYIDYTKAIHLDPTNTQTYIYRGQVILEMGNLKLAAYCVQHSVFMTKQSDNGFNNKPPGSASSSTQDNPKTTTTTTKDNKPTPVTQQAIVFTFLKQFSNATNLIENELKSKPKTELFNLLGEILMKADKWKEAVDAFDKSIELNVR